MAGFFMIRPGLFSLTVAGKFQGRPAVSGLFFGRGGRGLARGGGNRLRRRHEVKPALDAFKARIMAIQPGMDAGDILMYQGDVSPQPRNMRFQRSNPAAQFLKDMDDPILSGP